jgi:hypothetical protein
MATFGELKTEIAAKLTNGDLQYPTTSQIGDTINSIIKRYENKHFWFTQAEEEITLTVGDPVIPDIPDDFKNEVNPGGFVIVYNQLRYPLAKIKPDIYDSYNVEGTGLPYCYTYRNGEYLAYFYPDQAYTMFINYRKTFAELVADADSNDFTVYVDRLLVYACLEDIYATYRRDPDMASYYKTKAKDEFNEVMSETYERIASGSLTPDNAYSNGQFYNYWR